MSKRKPNTNEDQFEDSPLYNLEDLNPDIDEDKISGSRESNHDNQSPDEEDNQYDSNDGEKILSPIQILFKTMLTPVEGWKSLKRAELKPDRFASGCFYPILALAAISVAANFYYDALFSFTQWVEWGLITFITFFFGYFSVILIGSFVLSGKAAEFIKMDIGKNFVMLSMSTLALFWILIQLFPMIEPVLVFLPIWTIYLIFKGVRVLRINRENENTTTVLLCVLIISMPLFWNWLFSEFLLSK